MKKILVITLTVFLGAFTLAFSQKEEGDGSDSIANPVPTPQSKAPDGAKVGHHLEGLGERGSFRLTSKRNKHSQLIASVQVRDGKREVFINDAVLRSGARRVMKNSGLKDYETFKASVTEQLISVSSQESNELRWPWKCVFYCPIHGCENYDWIGFWD